MIGALWLGAALAQTPPDAYSRIDEGGIVIVRPVGAGFRAGFDNSTGRPFLRAVRAATDRETAWDFVMVFLGQGLPRQIEGALAFNQTLNRDLEGTGRLLLDNDEYSVNGALYMNRTTIWDAYAPEQVPWIFNHEIGHYWAAYVQAITADGRPVELLGRQNAHWSYFLHTENAPMEGNRWVDHGDGTFSTDPAVGPGGFSDLELYLMGLLPAEQVAPFFIIEPTDPRGRGPASAPDHRRSDVPTTIEGRRVDLTVDDIIAFNGPVVPGPDASPRDFRLLTVLVVGPEEIVDPEDLVRIGALQERYVEGFRSATRELAEVSFDPVEEHVVPRITEPAWVPEGAR